MGLTVKKLIEHLEGLDPDAPVIVGIMGGDRYLTAYADQLVHKGAPSLYICTEENPLPFEWGTATPTDNGDGTGTVEFNPNP